MNKAKTNKILSELGDEFLEKEDELKRLKKEIEKLENEDEDLHEEYDEMLNDILKDYTPCDILKAIDEVRYNIGYSEYIDNRVSDLEYNKNDLEEEINKLKENEKNNY